MRTNRFTLESRISVMINNAQSFNICGEVAHRIYQELDQFGPRKPMEIIAQTNHMFIIDKPQSANNERKSPLIYNNKFTLGQFAFKKAHSETTSRWWTIPYILSSCPATFRAWSQRVSFRRGSFFRSGPRHDFYHSSQTRAHRLCRILVRRWQSRYR